MPGLFLYCATLYSRTEPNPGLRGASCLCDFATVATNADAYVDQWWIDLRNEDELAKKFKKSIQDLVENLATRSKLMAPVA